MVSKMTVSCLFLTFFFVAPAFANHGPCMQIKDACTNAGFFPNAYKDGKGLWKDCINPIIQSKTAPDSKLPLPSVDPTTISECKTRHPGFGKGKVGT